MDFRGSVIFFIISTVLTASSILCEVGKGKNATDEANEALSSAVFANDPVAAQAAIDNGADIETKDDYWKWTPLHSAAWPGYVRVMEVLVKAGANLEALTRGNNTALHLAAWEGHNAAVEFLVKAGANIHAVGSLNQTPLMKAVHFKRHSTAELLRSLGARH